KCDICQKEYEENAIMPFRLRIGPRLGRIGELIGENYIKPIDLNVCDHCLESRKAKIINKFKSLLSSE
ncbi:hypothetical protein LCGC14_2727220, partial [marine sediment metagenome]